MPSLPVYQKTTRAHLRIATWAIYARYREMASFPGWFLLDALIPLIITTVPILLSRAADVDQPALHFASRAGTQEYAAFLLIGANTFLLTLRAFWDMGLWLRKEQQTGTLEALYTTPADRRWLLVGLAVFNLARGLVNLMLSFAIGCLLFSINPFHRDYVLALAFLIVGVVPLYALSLLYGVLVLRLKETDALIQIAQVVLTLALGIYYPVTALPLLAKVVALLFPPTWMNHGLRGALLGTGYLMQSWAGDLAILAGMALFGLPLAFSALRRAERIMQRGSGVGQF